MSIDDSCLALHTVKIIHVDRGQIADQYYQNSQTNRRFIIGHSQDKEHKHLPIQILEEMREGNEVGVDGKQHQFDGHQQDDQILPVQEQADHADAEKHSGQDEG